GDKLETRRKFEVRDLGAPIESATRLQIFSGVPQGAIIGRIDSDTAVIAPAVQVLQLGAAASHDGSFALQNSQRISGQATAEPNCRKRAAGRNAVADGNIPHFVHGNAAHPSAVVVRRVGALLIYREAA